jgi:hypothetical protein
MQKKQHSSFWMDEFDMDWDFSENSDSSDNSSTQSNNTTHLIRLSAARRAISNYVTILTNRSIPVMFNSSGTSLTDGNTVYIGADINVKNNFDVAVGLALHEGSHICYSDFNLFKTIWQKIPREIYDYTENLNINKEAVAKICQTILNVVEDRYIDYTVHKNAPGYREYYRRLYDRYFYSTTIDDGLKSNLYRTLSIESYLFRLINITNINTDLNALPGLYNIAKILNLTNIERLDTPEKRFDVALEIAKVIFKNINEHSVASESITEIVDFDQNTESDDSDKDNSSDESERAESQNKNSSAASDVSKLFGGEQTCADDVKSHNFMEDIGEDDKIKKTKKQKIERAFINQKNFIAGIPKKKNVTKKESQILNVLEKSNIDLVDVGADYLISKNIAGTIECILVKNMTRELIMSNQFPLSLPNHFMNGVVDKAIQNCINEGISMGIKIGRKLQFRNEINIDKSSRRETGKIDKRLLHELGCNADNIFYTIVQHSYKNINFHISVDASSSMYGEKWFETMRLCTAIAKAASMLNNINVTISFRTTLDNLPYVVIAYDSKKDKFIKIKSLFRFLYPTGLTPEGLCFESMIRILPKATDDVDNYFINISDGEPQFTYKGGLNKDYYVVYNGKDAALHTRHQIKKIREMNYKVLSYFISDRLYESDNTKSLFSIMYGKDAAYINVGNINHITDTLNKKLLERTGN